ncbi:hypothetical protein DFH07DRAFT_807700 [Mycena maculata]|uniref:BAH domain-containing protein n=1 Tax=Mycena maculata TaxID=230809 RepID=A0AAD7JNR1_9AGAR|nr:hypothetical protein DFH07DRAFT_807700 [Mycena maculata]
MAVARGRKPKKRKAEVPSGGDPNAPGPDEWADMEPYGSFTITDDDGREHVFKLGETAAVLPGGTKVGAQIPLEKYWIVRILGIRRRKFVQNRTKKLKTACSKAQSQTPEFWVNVHWYYSPKEVKEKIRGFTVPHCSKYERIYSDHSELISPLTFDALVPVMKFREDNPDQEPIFDEQFFTRYFLKTSSDPGELSTYTMGSSTRLQDSVGCLCGGPYDLNDKSPLHVMYMCPRPHCRRFYHLCCLLELGHWTPMTHPLIRLSCSPDTDDIPFETPCTLTAERPPQKTSDAMGSSSSCIVDELVTRLPKDLITLAAQSIVRGAALPNLGITGNCRDVVSARRIVYAAILKGTPAVNEWEERLDVDAAIVESDLPVLQHEDTGKAVVLMCPNCHGPI